MESHPESRASKDESVGLGYFLLVEESPKPKHLRLLRPYCIKGKKKPFSLLLLHLCSPRRRVRRKRKRKLERKRKRATEFLKLERRKTLISFLLFTVQISSNVDPASCVIRSTWNLKKRFPTHWSLIWTVEIGFGVPLPYLKTISLGKYKTTCIKQWRDLTKIESLFLDTNHHCSKLQIQSPPFKMKINELRTC